MLFLVAKVFSAIQKCGKMKNNQKATVSEMMERIQAGGVLLAPLRVLQVVKEPSADGVFIEVQWGGRSFRFSCGCKSRSTPQAIHLARADAQRGVAKGIHPLVYVPYLSPERLSEFEAAGESAIDLCGNGVIQVPEKLCVIRSGNVNRFRDSRPLNDPFSGRSSLVGRAFAVRGTFPSLTGLAETIRALGGQISLPQVSKAVSALVEELLVEKGKDGLKGVDTVALLRRLASGWGGGTRRRVRIMVGSGLEWPSVLGSRKGLRWAVSGMFSLRRYAPFAIAGVRAVMVSDLDASIKALRGKVVPAGEEADLELLEATDEECFFDTRVDEENIHWAGPVQTWMELQGGQGRYLVAAEKVLQFILDEQSKRREAVRLESDRV